MQLDKRRLLARAMSFRACHASSMNYEVLMLFHVSHVSCMLVFFHSSFSCHARISPVSCEFHVSCILWVLGCVGYFHELCGARAVPCELHASCTLASFSMSFMCDACHESSYTSRNFHELRGAHAAPREFCVSRMLLSC